MRIALLTVGRTPDSLDDCAGSLARGMESKGHRVERFGVPGYDGMSLPGFEYVVVLAESSGFFSSSIPSGLAKLLTQPSSLVGKRSAAFVRSKGPFSQKTLSRLMQAMEHEGMLVTWSEVLENPAQAESLGASVG